MKALAALVLSGIVLSGCDSGSDNQEKAPEKEIQTWLIKVEQPGIADVIFTTGYQNCVEGFRMANLNSTPIYGYVIYKPNGEQIIVSGTARITRTPNNQQKLK